MIARPSIPSSFAIAAAVTAWSPVIIRTLIPAALAVAIAALAVGRGGSTMPTRVSAVKLVELRQQVAGGSNDAGSKSLPCGGEDAQALLAQTLVLGQVALLHPVVDRDRAKVVGGERGRAPHEELVGAPLTKQRTTSSPPSFFIRWKLAISL